mmetsp:Transcript_2902/g.6731  ORF Transcript_2902/g.6731 Transcript_2902/m.6731 type:complete len:205 (-) Transcript_2902:235-849(-)|eukprot:CAMPEP_0201125850 /NCGR_PEP_ID=MMETSP0850-20130426/23448_1 /ASSEMBLY_ACC=CAM_ASM_000622 /TAXON_ID=183588 /ORGANISM="Pseudo-nitzschia fraudulenta, Strain WWA7" /LENGTH=204 /DNA_ID=CAMNT_0047394027 /DNA_START=336 /DNA_END=950 /DNA_ORIENTATION=-
MILSSNKLLTGVFTLSLAIATNAFGLPPQKPLVEYSKTCTMLPPFFGYETTVNTDKLVNQLEVSGYVTGAPIDELFALVNDFTEDSVFWKKTLKFDEVYRSGNPNGVGTVRDFSYITNPDAQYVEMMQYSDPENHALVYTMQAARDKRLNSLAAFVTMVDEPENNRVKVTWRALLQTPVPFLLLKNRQTAAYAKNIEVLQTFYP